MRNKIKKLIYFMKKKGLLLFLLFSFIALLFPSFVSAATVWDWMWKAWSYTPLGMAVDWGTSMLDMTPGHFMMALLVTIVNIPLALANFFFGISASVLKWVVSPDFISLSYTGMDNPVVRMGWTITRDLANMGIVIALIVIGLATILRLESYQAQKTLPLLIIVALLINFTPVILGVIVDASNILMNYLLAGFLGFDSLVDVFSDQWADLSIVWNNASSVKGSPEFFDWSPLARTGALIFFATISGFILLLFALLFIMRYVAIWIAVVLSPLAFVAYILPKTRAFFDIWWKQFITWCFIGVFAAFFLYLSSGILDMASPDNQQLIHPLEEGVAVSARAQGGAEKPGALTDFFNEVFPFAIVIGLLLIGLFTSIAISAMGANTIVDLTKKGGKAAGKGVAGFAGRQTLGRLATSKSGKAVGRWLARRQIPRVREAKSGLGKLGAMAVAPLAPFRWAVQKAGAGILSYGAGQQERINKTQEEIEKRFGKDYKSMAAYTSSLAATNYQGKIAGAQALAKTKGAKGLKELSESDLNSIIEKTNRYAPATLQNLIKHKPELIDDAQVGNIVRKNLVSKGLDDEEVKKVVSYGVEPAEAIRDTAFKKAVEALKPSDVENLSNETIENADFQKATARYKPWSFIRKIGEEKGGNYVSQIQEEAQKIGIKEIAKSNPAFLKAAYTPGGQAYLGNWRRAKGKGGEIADKEGINKLINENPPLEKDEAKRKIEEYRKRQGAAMGPKPTPPPSGRRPGGTAPSGRRPGGTGPSGRRTGGGGTPSGRRI